MFDKSICSMEFPCQFVLIDSEKDRDQSVTPIVGSTYIGYLTIKVVGCETICEVLHIEGVDHPSMAVARIMARIIVDSELLQLWIL